MTSERATRTSLPVRLRTGVAALVAVLLVSGSLLVPIPRAFGADLSSFGEPFHFLEPLAAPAGDPSDFDASLLDQLIVSICRVEATACTPVKTLTSASSLSERLRIGPTPGGGAYYLANWDTQRVKLSPNTFRVTVTVARLQLGSIDIGPNQYKSFGRTWPIKFIVENDPTIRVRVLREAGKSASQVANAIKREFGLSPEEVAALLANDLDPFTDAEIELALKGVFQAVDVKPATKVADDATQAALTTFDATTGRMTFAATTPTLANLKVGDVLVGEPDDAAPNGYLRYVNAIAKPKKGPMVVETRQAYLDEVLKKGTLDAAGDLLPDDIDRTEAMAGVELMTSRAMAASAAFGALDIGDGYSFHQSIDIELKGNVAGGGASGQGTVHVQGSMHFNAGYNLGFGVEECLDCPPFFTHVDRLEAHLNADFNTDITVSGDFDGTLDREVTLSTHYFKPIVFFIGPIPVVLVPIVKAIAGIHGDAHLDFTFDAQVHAAIDVGAKWTDPDDNGTGWDWISPKPAITGDADGDLKVKMELRAYAKADAKLLLYGIAGPGIAGRVGVGADVDFPRKPLWYVFGHAQGAVNFAVDIGGILKLAEFSEPLPEWRENLAQSVNEAPMCGARSERILVALHAETYLGPRGSGDFQGYFDCQDPEGDEPSYTAKDVADNTPVNLSAARWDEISVHVIEITASDDDGKSTTFRITVEVVNTPPIVTVTAPSESVPASVQYFVAAYAYDVETGALLPCSSFNFSATGGTVTPKLDNRSCAAVVVFTQTGPQTVTIRATDTNGKSEEKLVTVNVTAAPPNAAPVIDPDSFKVWAARGPITACEDNDPNCDIVYSCPSRLNCRVPTGAVLHNGMVGDFHRPLTFSLAASDPNGSAVTVTWHCTAGSATFAVTSNGDGTFSCSPFTPKTTTPIHLWAEVSDGTTTVSSEVRSYIMYDHLG